jgi:muramoyltetrapeptide carboxypeptidase
MAGLPSVHGISGYQFFGWPDADVPTETAFWKMVSGSIAGLEVAGEDWRSYRAESAVVSGPPWTATGIRCVASTPSR